MEEYKTKKIIKIRLKNEEEMLGFLDELKRTKIDLNQEVVFDFANQVNYPPSIILILALGIKKFRREYPENVFRLIRIENKDTEYAGHMGFFKLISEDIDYGKMPGEAKGGRNYLPITKMNAECIHEDIIRKGIMISKVEAIEEETIRLSNVLIQDNKELRKVTQFLLREIIRNVPEHAETDEFWYCAQNYPHLGYSELVIVDEGKGIYKNLKENESHSVRFVSNSEALEWAIKPGISDAFDPRKKQRNKDTWANSGYGLYVVSNLCKELGGIFYLISQENYIAVDTLGVVIGKTFFDGTAIIIRLKNDLIINVDEIIEKIRIKGEEEAKEMKVAFKKASPPSNGLMK